MSLRKNNDSSKMVKKTTKVSIPKGSSKLNVPKEYKNKKDVKVDSSIELVKRFLKLTPKQARPLKSVVRGDKIFRIEKQNGRTNKYFVDNILVTKSVFTNELNKQFVEWKRKWQKNSIRLQRLNEKLERRRLLSDPSFRISSRYSNKIDDRIRTINDVKVKKEEYEKRWKEYIEELESREDKEEEEGEQDDLRLLIGIFEMLINYSKEYIEKYGVVNYGIHERVYTLRNLYVDRNILDACKVYVDTLGEMGLQVRVKNLVTGKITLLSSQNFEDYLFSVDNSESDLNHIVFTSGSDVFNILGEDDIEATDYEFSLLPIAPERRKFKTRKEYDDFKKIQKNRRNEYYGLINKKTLTDKQQKRLEELKFLLDDDEDIFSGFLGDKDIKQPLQGNMSPFVYDSTYLNHKMDNVKIPDYIYNLKKKKFERVQEDFTLLMYDQICELFDDVQVYSDAFIEEFKKKKMVAPPCLDYSVKKYLEKQIAKVEEKILFYARKWNYSLGWNENSETFIFEVKDEYDNKYKELVHNYDNLKTLINSFHVPQVFRSRFGYVPTTKLEEICELNNIIIRLCIDKSYNNAKCDAKTFSPKNPNNLTILINLNYCRETEHYYSTFDYSDLKIKWSMLIPGKQGHILSSRCLYNSLREISFVREMNKAEKLTTMGFRTFDKEKFQFTPFTITTESYDDKLELRRKWCKGLIQPKKDSEKPVKKAKVNLDREPENVPLIPECQTQEEFDGHLNNLIKNRKPINKWNRALLITFDFETFKSSKEVIRTTDGKLNIPMSCSMHMELGSKKIDLHYYLKNTTEYASMYSPDMINYIRNMLDDVHVYYKRVISKIMLEEQISEKKAMMKYKPQLAAHNLSFDFSFMIPFLTDVELFGTTSNTKIAKGKYRGINLSFLNTTNFFPCALAKIAKSFKIDTPKEVFPYDYYNISNFNKNREDLNVFCESIPDDNDKLHVGIVCVEKGWYNVDDNSIDIKEYRKYYNNLDVSILYKVITTFWELINNETGIDVSHLKTSGSIVKFLYEKTGCFIGTHELTGDLSEYIRQNLQGGRVATAYNKGKIIEEDQLADLDVNSEYPASMVQMIGFLKGKPQYFSGVYKQPRCNGVKMSELFLYTDGKRVTDYFANIKILNVNKALRIPFISDKVKGVRKYTNEPGVNILVNKTMLEVYGRYHGLTQEDFIITSGIQYVDGYNRNVAFLTNRLYSVRKSPENAGTAVDECLKLLLNSGYGKLGEKEYDLKIVYSDTVEDASKIYFKNPTGFISSEISLLSVLTNTESLAHLAKTGLTNNNRLKITYLSEKVKNYSSYAHEAYRCLAQSKMIIGEYQYALRKAGFKLRYTDTDSLHVSNYTPEKYEKFLRIYKDHTGKEVSKEALGGISSDFKKPEVKEGEILNVDSLICKRAVYIRAKQYYMEIYYTVTLPTGETVERRYPIVKCKGIKTNSLINHALLVEKDHSDKCDALFNFYKERCQIQERMKEYEEHYKELGIKNKMKYNDKMKSKFTVDSAENGKQFSVQYVYGAPVARTHFPRMF